MPEILPNKVPQVTYLLSLEHTIAGKCYQEQLEAAREVRDAQMESAALGSLGVTRMNLGRHEVRNSPEIRGHGGFETISCL